MKLNQLDLEKSVASLHLSRTVSESRKILGNSNLEVTARKVAEALARRGIPHLFLGGYAVQHHGYSRFTSDIDVVVPNVSEARDYLSISGFKEVPGTTMIVQDRVTGITVDILPAEGSIGPSVVPLPTVSSISSEPVLATIEQLITNKLSTYLKNPVHRAKDLGDVVELIKHSDLPRTLEVAPEVQQEYFRIWDGLQDVR